jgi:hypothetical protein
VNFGEKFDNIPLARYVDGWIHLTFSMAYKGFLLNCEKKTKLSSSSGTTKTERLFNLE